MKDSRVERSSKPRYGIDPFDVGYGASFAAEADSPFDVECEVIEDGGTLRPHDPKPGAPPSGLAFVDGTMRTDARLTRTGADGVVYSGLAGSWAVGAAVDDGNLPLAIGGVVTERVAIFCGGVPVSLPPQPGGWSWAADAVDAASSWLPRYASAAHRDKRAPVNLTPVAGLEAQLRRRAGDSRLALRAVRDAITQLNAQGGRHEHH